MMDWTDRHCRYFMRLLNPRALLYTEMVTAAAIVHGNANRFLRFRREQCIAELSLSGFVGECLRNRRCCTDIDVGHPKWQHLF